MQDQYPSCQGLYSALDCLSLSDFIVQTILLAICLLFIVVVLLRLKRMAQHANYTLQQSRQLKQCNFIHYIILLYLIVFELCTFTAGWIYIELEKKWFITTDRAIDSFIVKSLIRSFWMLLYGYITLLNIIFFIIAYTFLVKSKILRHEKRSEFPFWGCFVAVVFQLLSYCAYIFLIFQYQSDPSTIQSHYLQALRYINLSWSVICTLVLLYIFFITYKKKVSASAYISQHIKKTENRNIFWLTFLHLLRICVETFNIVSGGMICKWRELDENTFLDSKNWYSIYLSVANMSMNVVPVFFILKVFRPPRKEFLRPSLIESEVEEE